MSQRKQLSKEIVVDASIARAASEIAATSDRGSAARDALIAVRGGNHRLVLGAPSLVGEWDRHQSGFSKRWRTAMQKAGKILQPSDAPPEFLISLIRATLTIPAQQQAALKDAHLLAAAMSTGQRIISLDSTARSLFHEVCQSANAPELVQLLWADLLNRRHRTVDWLRAGARDTARIRLSSL